MKKILTSICLLLCCLMSYADLPFRNHRFDGFKVLPVKSDNIVFIGNSITNMHEWWEAFGSNPKIINRGVSGATSAEALANIKQIANGKPAKVFLMLGTNDLGTNGLNKPELVVNNVKQIVEHLQKNTPHTEIYLQSILPSKVGIRNLALEKSTNENLKKLCEEKNITFIDLWSDLLDITENFNNTLDGLHLKASGYEIWCKKIEKYVGCKSIYTANTKNLQQTGGLPTSYGMRNTYFSVYPTKSTDILMIGDEMIHGGEWHELLQSGKVKNRGTGWGYPGPDLKSTLASIPIMLRPTEQQPSKIFLYAGVHDVNNQGNINEVASTYKKVVDKIKECAPLSQLFLMSLQPTANAQLNHSKIVPFNEKLKAMAEATEGVSYLDIYSDFVQNDLGKEDYFMGNYLSGMGYAKVAQKVAQAINDPEIVALTDAEAKKNYYSTLNLEENQIIKAAQIKDGWYEVRVLDGSHPDMKDAISKGKDYILTVNKEYRQVAGGNIFYYPLKYGVKDTNHSATSIVRINRQNEGLYFTALNGHKVHENCTASRDIPSDLTPIMGTGELTIGHWTAFNAKDGSEWPYVGKFSSQSATYKIFDVPTEKLEQYDIYPVSILGCGKNNEVGHDAQLICNNPNLQSVASVFNGGWFFFKKGTKLELKDFRATPIQGKKAEIVIGKNQIQLIYSNGCYPMLELKLNEAIQLLKNSTEGTNPGCYSTEARKALQEVVDKTILFNKTEGKKQAEIDAAMAELSKAVEHFTTQRIDIVYSTEGHETWYYIVSAAEFNYCHGKAIQSRAGKNPLTYASKKADASMIWSFWKDANGKIAIRNYAGRYMSPSQEKGNSEAGMVNTPAYNYELTIWNGLSDKNCAFTIQSDCSTNPIHAQQDGTVIVTWPAADHNASLWNLEQLTDEELNAEISLSTKVEQVQVTTGIGNTNVPLLRVTFDVKGLKGSKTIKGIQGNLNNKTAVSKVKIYQTSDEFEFRTGKEDAVLLGSATPQNDGTFNVTFDKPSTLRLGNTPYLWIVADIQEKAKEGDTIDAMVTAYNINDEKVVENQGNPTFHTTIFLTAGTVEYLNTYGSRYYRIPAITTAPNGWLVAVADRRWDSETDLPNNIDVIASISKDNGKTWTTPLTIAGTTDLGGDYGHGDPAIVTDTVTGDIIVLVTSKVGFFYGTPENPPLIKMIASHDNGITWDTPVDITSSLYGSACSDPVRKSYHSLFVSSGSFTQLKNGTLMAVAPVRVNSAAWGAHDQFQAHVISSSDHGKTWTMSNVNALSDADESKIIELDNSDLLIKSRKNGHPYYVISKDGGKTWSSKKQWNEIQDPGCNGDLLRYTAITNNGNKNRILASVPNSNQRSNVSVFMSYDEGESWPVVKSICPKGSGYSSLTILNDQTIGCYYEENALEGGYQLRFVRFSLDWLTDGKDQIKNENSTKDELIGVARETLAKMGVGYPTDDAPQRKHLENAIQSFAQSEISSEDIYTFNQEIEKYKGSKENIQMPEEGKAYIFSCVAKDGSLQYLNYGENEMKWSNSDKDATLYVCKKEDKKYAFINNEGKFLTWFGNRDGFNNNKGFAEQYEPDWCNLTVEKMSGGQFVETSKASRLFGYVAIKGQRGKNGKYETVYFVTGKNNGKAGALEPFFTDAYSSAIIMTEVPYANVVLPEEAEGLSTPQFISSFSAPFATLIPNGVKAYYVKSIDAEKKTATMQPVEGVIPANEGVIITAETGDSIIMVPATSTVSAKITGNALKHSAGAEKIMDKTTENPMILSNVNHKYAFYPAKDQAVLPMNRAYLSTENMEEVLYLDFDASTTGITDIKNEFSQSSYYDLSGRRVYKIIPGNLYISNGKKFIQK